MNRVLISLALFLGTLLIIALFFGEQFTETINQQWAINRLVFLLGYLLLVSGSLYAGYKREGSRLLVYLGVWLAIGGLIAVVYQVMN